MAANPMNASVSVALSVENVGVCRSMPSYIHKEGNATIAGHAFLRRPDNTTQNAVGQTVRLIPLTPYSEARFAQFYRGKKFLPAREIPKLEADPEYASYTRTTTASRAAASPSRTLRPANITSPRKSSIARRAASCRKVAPSMTLSP
jgi:hypothetical protein